MTETTNGEREAVLVLGKGFDNNENAPSTKVKKKVLGLLGKKSPRTKPSVEMRLNTLANVLISRKERVKLPRYYSGGAVAGERYGSEAEFMRNTSNNMSHNLRSTFSSTESDARRTSENMANTRRQLEEAGIPRVNIVTTSFHGDRARELAEKAGIEVGIVHSAEDVIKSEGGRASEIVERYDHSLRRRKEAFLEGVINFAEHNPIGRVGLNLATAVLRKK